KSQTTKKSKGISIPSVNCTFKDLGTEWTICSVFVVHKKHMDFLEAQFNISGTCKYNSEVELDENLKNIHVME
ncbi:hypothetical protein STEG23_015746, partial [Scotinomys teguina]